MCCHKSLTCIRRALLALTVLLAVFVTSCGKRGMSAKALGGDWHEFNGTWTAVGERSSLRLLENRNASIATFTGSLTLAGPSRPGVGFRSDVIIFSDTATGLVGRAVWTDENGDAVYSELRGEGTAAARNKITGTFIGGTGRYSKATGSYGFSWRFVIENEEGLVQGQAVDLNGRIRVDSASGASSTGSPKS